MGKFLDYIKDKMDLKSHRQRMDERFENGIQVAAALAPKGTKVGQKAYFMHKNAKRAYESSPRDIIRHDIGFYPYKVVERSLKNKYDRAPYLLRNGKGETYESDEPINSFTHPFAFKKNGDLRKGWSVVDNRDDFRKDFDSAVNSVRERRNYESNYKLNGDISAYKRARKDLKDFGKDSARSTIDAHKTFVDDNYKLFDWNGYVAARKASKEQGQKLGRMFAERNNLEKSAYRSISYGRDPKVTDGVKDKYFKIVDRRYPHEEPQVVNENAIAYYRDAVDSQGNKKYDVIPMEHPVYAFGGQNAQYLDQYLNLDNPQSAYEMRKSAKPIHYDKDGNPYVRGFTWTQTGNIPKITDPNSGYLATVGADTKNYHPHVKGQWTSEGWGNPMDKNYENGVRPGYVNVDADAAGATLWDMKLSPEDRQRLTQLRDDHFYDKISGKTFREGIIEIAKKNGVPYEKTFNEQLLETRWPLKFYQKAPFINQGGTQERVTVMGAGPGAKDVHRPVMGEVVTPSEMKRKLDKLNNQHFADLKDLQERMIADGIPQGSPEWQKQVYILDRDWRERDAEIRVSYPEGTRMYERVMAPVGTSVDKVATPSRMITAHMEDNMPSEWTMYDRRNGGKTIAGWHPNKKWSEMNAEKFADEVRKLNPELYKEISKAYEDEYGLGHMELAANGPKFVGRWFLENPDKLDALKRSKVSDITRVMERNNELSPQYALIDRARAQSLMDVPVKTPYEYSSMAFDHLPSRDVFAKGSMYRGEQPYTFSRSDDETPKSVMDFYKSLDAKRNVIRKRWNKNGKLSAEDEEELVRLNSLAERIEEDYGW